MTNANRNKSLQLLQEGFKQDFAVSVIKSERFTELLMELSQEFVEQNIPVVDEDDIQDMAFLLMESIKLTGICSSSRGTSTTSTHPGRLLTY